MRHRLRFAALALAAMSFAGLAAAEPIGSHWELTPFAGYTMFDGKLRFPGSNLPLTDNLLLWVQVRSATPATANRVLDSVETHGFS